YIVNSVIMYIYRRFPRMSTPPPKKPRVLGRGDELSVTVEPGEPSASHLAEALFLATQALKSTGRTCGEEAADPALRAISLPRGRVLMAMEEARDERVRMGDLAEALGVTARNITTIVDGLEREELIARRPDPTDRRAIVLELTHKAHEHIAKVHALHCAVAERFFAPLSADERHELLRLLLKVGGGTGAGGRGEQA